MTETRSPPKLRGVVAMIDAARWADADGRHLSPAADPKTIKLVLNSRFAADRILASLNALCW
jgi:hypothetical protein